MPNTSIVAKRTILKKLLAFAIVGLLYLLGCSDSLAEQLRDGDIIFQTSRSEQSTAIQKATRSQYSHMGIVFLRNGSPHVYEAIKTVQYTPLRKWVDRGEGGHYVVKRLREADRILTSQAVKKLRQAGSKFEGKPYDSYFEWSDKRIYCSELVWKIYDRGLGIRVGRLQKVLDLDLSDPIVKTKIKERYGDKVPLDETVISPGEMFSSDLLITVTQK
jgi:uncharacterized protein YycO